jgi:putative tricarboxylic transport membrane protein
VLLGAFIAQGLRPGPRLFSEFGDIMYALLIGMVIASFLLLILTYPTTKYMAYVTKIPSYIIVPTVFIMTVIGAYAVNNSWFDVRVMLFFGFVGFLLKKFDIPLAPMVIGSLLTQMTETNLVRTVILFGDNISALLTRPIVAFFLLATVVGTILIVKKPKEI